MLLQPRQQESGGSVGGDGRGRCAFMHWKAEVVVVVVRASYFPCQGACVIRVICRG